MDKDMSDLILGRYPEFLEDLELPRELVFDGACRGTETGVFFSDNLGEINQAKQVCSACPIRQKCLDYALFAEEFGVWGGTTHRERAKLRGGKPLFSLEERRYAVQFRNDLPKLTAPEFAQKYGITERTCFRWRLKLGVEVLAS